MRTLAASLLLALATIGCSDGDKAPPDNTRGCRGAGCAFVTTSHYNPDFSGTGTLHTVKMPERQVTANLDATLDPDTTLQVAGGKLWALDHESGALRRYDLGELKVDFEIPTGNHDAANTTSTPVDFWLMPGSSKVYVSLSGNDGAHAVGVLDQSQPNAGVTKFIAVPATADDSDGKPEAGRLYSCNNLLYVVLQDYTIMGRDVVYHAGRIGVIDPAKDMLVGTITLAGQNPALLLDAGDCNRPLAVTSGNVTALPDGTAGLERLDLKGMSTGGFLARDTDLGGRPSLGSVASATLGFLGIYSDPQTGQDGKMYLASAKAISFNPQTGQALADVTGKAGFLNFVSVSPDHGLYVGVGAFGGMAEPGKLAEGLYVGAADGSPITAPVITLGQTPAAIAFGQ